MAEIMVKVGHMLLEFWLCRTASGRYVYSQRDDKIVKIAKTSYCTTWKKWAKVRFTLENLLPYKYGNKAQKTFLQRTLST